MDYFNDPRNAAMLALGAGLLAPQQFKGFGTALGSGMLSALNAYQATDANNAQRAMIDAKRQETEAQAAERQMQIEAARVAAERSERIRQQIAGTLPTGQQVVGSLPQVGNGAGTAEARQPDILQDPGARVRLYRQWSNIYAANGDVANAEKYAKLALDEMPEVQEVYDASTGAKMKAQITPDGTPLMIGGIERPQAPWEYEEGPDGRARMRPEVLDAKRTVAAAGAPQTKIDLKMGESVAGQIGPMLRAARERTEGAINLGRGAEEIISAIDAGNVIAGPGATIRLFGAQLADMVGIGGKDTAEKLQNTRRVVRSLADAAVEARKRLAGQGQVTENEAKAVEKASSGDINDLTVEEIRLIANLNRKAAALAARDYSQQIEAMPPEMGNMRPFYEIPGLDRWTMPPATGGANVGGFKIERVQ